eukprot:scaffold122078_cov33-Phaeocystis_antarctica.AAC.1
MRWPPGVASSRAVARCETRRMAQVSRKPAAPATVCDRGCNPMSAGLQPYVGAGEDGPGEKEAGGAWFDRVAGRIQWGCRLVRPRE